MFRSPRHVESERMKAARSIVPALAPRVETANGQPVAAVGSAASLEPAAQRALLDARRSVNGRPVPTMNRAAASSARRCFRNVRISAPLLKMSTRDRNMARTTLIRTILLASITTLGIGAISPSVAGDQRLAETNAQGTAQGTAQGIDVVGSDVNSRFISLGVGKSVVIDLPRDIKDVLIADPKTANAVVRSARRAFIIGAAVGPDQYLLLRCRRPPDRRLRHRGQARSQRHTRRHQAGAADIRHPGRRRRRRHPADRQCRRRRRGPNGLRHRIAAPRRRNLRDRAGRRQDRECHHGPRPRPNHDQGHGRGNAAQRDQAAGHRSQRHIHRRAGGDQLQQY